MSRKPGFVLICVLWVLAVLTIITIGFGRRAMLDMRASVYNMNREQALMMARGAVWRGVVEVRNKGFKEAITEPEQRGGTNLGEAWNEPVNLMEEDYFTSIKGDEFEDDAAEYSIIDLERYIDINNTPKEVLENIESLSRSAKRRIWKRRTEGVHEGEPRAPFRAVEELRYLRGVRDDDWYGEKDKLPLYEMVTVMGGEKINVNTASAEVLKCIPDLDEDVINKILAYRAGGDGEIGTGDDLGFPTIRDIQEELQLNEEITGILFKYCKTTSNYFKITGIVTRQRQLVRAVCSAIVHVNGTAATLVEWREENIGT